MLLMRTGDYGDFKTLVHKFRANDIITFATPLEGSVAMFAATAMNRDNAVQINFEIQTQDGVNPPPPDVPTFLSDFPKAVQISNVAGIHYSAISAWIPGTREFWAVNYDDFKAVVEAVNFGGPVVYLESGGTFFIAHAVSYDSRFLATLHLTGAGATTPPTFLTDFPNATLLNSPLGNLTDSPLLSQQPMTLNGATLDQYFYPSSTPQTNLINP